MKMTKKIVAGMAATVLALSMMVGTAFAQRTLPATWGDEENGAFAGEATSDNHVWLTLCGGGEQYSDQETANKVAKVIYYFDGDCTIDVSHISNTEKGGWSPSTVSGVVINGVTPVSCDIKLNPKIVSAWVEAIVNVYTKTAGPLSLVKAEFVDASGNVLVTIEPKANVPATTPSSSSSSSSLPKTGVVSTALVFGLGATAFGTGATLLKKKED